ncbi:WD repeat-containing protein 13 [Nymphaea thermarum]|nr:WD repeat-containing protein 13 [Nymphaea thermarum]
MGEESVEMEVEFPKDEVANHEDSSKGKDEESVEKEGEKEECSSVEEAVRTEEDQRKDAEAFSCLLQPSVSGSDPFYVGVRRLLLYRKALSGRGRRKEWRCNGKAYVAYRNYIRRPRNWENMQMPSQTSTPGNSGRWASSSGVHNTLYEADSWSSSRDLQGLNPALSHCASSSSTFSESDHLIRFVEPAYSFVGMHCIFDSCKASVTVVKFGHMSSDLLAYGASDGSLTVCTVTQPPAILQQLKGHSKDITDFDFSLNNQYICSSSLDKTVRIWEISKGHCVRVIYGVSSQLCIRFHPVNNNFVSVGNSNREITVINFSTGRIISKITFESEITAMDNDHTGQLIFAGDNQGCVHSMSIDSHTGALSRSHRNRSISKNKSRITTVQYRTFSLLARGPVLLTCSQDGTISFFSVTLEIKGYLTLRCSLKIPPRTHGIHASFCPLLSLEKGEFIVSGSEDSCVYFYDLTKPKHTCGHGSPVIGIAWNHGENLLASSDSEGMVIVWKRAKSGKQ